MSSRISILFTIAAIGCGYLFGGVQTYRLAAERQAHAATKAAHAEQIAALERAAHEAEVAARSEEQRRTRALQGIINDTEQKLSIARDDAAAAADAGQRLRAQLAAVTASCRRGARHTAASPAGAPAIATHDLLADVQRRMGEATDGIARYADAAHAAGAACERSYRALAPDAPALDR